MQIFVMLGTQNKPFTRLLKEIEQSDFVNQHKVIAQIGYSVFKSDKFDVFDFCSQEEINQLIKQSDLLIMHAGVGSITQAIKLNKKVIVAPRLSKYKEMKNDHQLEIMQAFVDKGYVLPLYNFNEIDEVVNQSKTFVPTKYQTNSDYLLEEIDHFITNN